MSRRKNDNMTPEDLAAYLPLLRAADSGARLIRLGNRQYALGNGPNQPILSEASLRRAIGLGLVGIAQEGLVTTEPGRRLLADLLAGRCDIATTGQGKAPEVLVNLAESPLDRLYHKGKRNSFLRRRHVLAGERLRRDFELSRMQPRLSPPLRQKVDGGGPSGPFAGMDDNALDARRRFEDALKVLDEMLAAVAVDACCRLKGLAEIERERQIPIRSGKIVLRIALSLLARHYGFEDRPRRRGIRHWGDTDYRPSLPP